MKSEYLNNSILSSFGKVYDPGRMKSDLERRLEAYFATLRSSSPREALKRKVGHWQIYAAVSGSAIAMATGAAASIIRSSAQVMPDPIASVRARQALSSSKGPPFLREAMAVMARQGQGNEHASIALAPSIARAGVVPIFGTGNIIQSAEWVSIYGQNLASVTASWNGDFPTSLGGASVTINGKPAYLSYVSPGQINLQAPDDTAYGTVPVVVITAAGRATTTVTLGGFAPSFSLLHNRLIAGIIVRSDGSGAYGGGTYDILGPTGNALGYRTVAANPGDVIELFGVGFGPTTPAVPAGKPFTGAAPAQNAISLTINSIAVNPTFVGISSAGLFQINLIVPPGLGDGEVPIQATVAGMQTPKGVLFSLERSSVVTGTAGTYGGTYPGGTVGGFGSGSGGGFGGGTGGGYGGGTGGGYGGGTGGGYGGGTGGGYGGGTGGGFGGGSGGGGGGGSGGGSGAIRKKPYQPWLRFPPDVENA